MIERLLDRLNQGIPNPKLKSLLLHGLFWSVWLSRTLFDIYGAWGWSYSLMYVGITFITQAPLVYLHLYLLVPKLLNQRRYLTYLLLTAGFVYVYSLLNYTLVQNILPRENMPLSMQRFLERLQPNFDMLEGVIVVILTYALKYTLIAFITQNELLRLQKEKLNLELNALKAQIHPHFLFNTLNNLYSLTLKNSAKASEVVLKLSDIMRYVLYQANEERVPLTREINFIRNFVELQRIRYDSSADIRIEISGNQDAKEVAPLLFIDFAENAFKHGLEKRYSDGYVHISFTITEQELLFRVVNSKADQEEISNTPKPGGIGLANVKKRLGLIYPHTHELKIIDGPTAFEIQLKLTFP